MKTKTFIIGLGIAAVVAAGGILLAKAPMAPLAAADKALVEEPAIETTIGEDAGATIDEAALQEILASMSEANALPEVELDEEAMADFLERDMVTTASGLQYIIEEEGNGAIPEAGNVVQIHYVGKLADGTIFDSSYDRGEPIAFPLGQGFVILGWDEAVSLLPVGSEAKFVISPDLAYGESGVPGVIPPNATLYFEVELLDILPGSPEAPVDVAQADFTVTESGLKYHDLAEGDGATPEEGQVVSLHYTGWLEDGTKFDSSLDLGMPVTIPVGAGYVLPGLEEGLDTMKVGGKRQLVIPADLAYGEEGAGDVIPPNTALIFEIELVDIQG